MHFSKTLSFAKKISRCKLGNYTYLKREEHTGICMNELLVDSCLQ